MNCRRDFDGVERSLVDLELGTQPRTIEIRILAGFGVLVVLSNRRFKVLGIDARVLGKFSQRLAFLGKPQFKGRTSLLDALTNLIVKDFKSRTTRLLRHSGTRHVARGEFADKALAFAIHKHRTCTAHRFGNNHGTTDQQRRIELNFLGIDYGRANLLCKHHTVALTARLIGRLHIRADVRTQ